jgi:hypothetical protein
MFARLTERALDSLARSKEFRRTADNSVYHKGYPISYRQQGGVPSIQISIALDGRRADIDVDYRSSSFPVSMFNGHLNAANSDVRAGNNSDRHTTRWVGLQNWWGSFFGARVERAPDVATKTLTLPKAPRVGRKTIDVMVHDFLNAWLVEGDVAAAMGYVSERAYACLAQDREDPSDFDRGMAPFQIMVGLKAAHEALGARKSLEDVTVGVRFTRPGLKVVTQPHHKQFVISSVADDVAAAFDCESRLTPGDSKNVSRAYGNYFGATFYIDGRKDHTVALLWARDNGYWKIVSWKSGADEEDKPEPDAPPVPKVVRVKADPSLVQAARGFLELACPEGLRRGVPIPLDQSYACYDLARSPTKRRPRRQTMPAGRSAPHSNAWARGQQSEHPRCVRNRRTANAPRDSCDGPCGLAHLLAQ